MCPFSYGPSIMNQVAGEPLGKTNAETKDSGERNWKSSIVR